MGMVMAMGADAVVMAADVRVSRGTQMSPVVVIENSPPSYVVGDASSTRTKSALSFSFSR